MSAAAARLREVTVAQVLDGDGRTSTVDRRAAFDNTSSAPELRPLLDKVARSAYKVTDDDIAAATAAGRSEDEVFELVVCAAIGQAARQLDAALAALDATDEARS